MLSMKRLSQPAIIAAIVAALSATLSLGRAGSGTGSVQGIVNIADKDGSAKSDRSQIVVYLEGVPGPSPDLEKLRRSIRQRDQTFSPDLTVVVKGATIDFPNEDKVFHNVFSLSEAAKFDLGLYKQGESKSITFRRTGVVDLYCNIHPEMVAKIVVVDTAFFAVTGADGRFRLDGVPAGTYPVVAWQARGAPYRGEVTVTAGGSAALDIKLVEGQVTKTHLRKDGTPYGRYK
jgi:plastocyanin